jgi:hypothetical protein
VSRGGCDIVLMDCEMPDTWVLAKLNHIAISQP